MDIKKENDVLLKKDIVGTKRFVFSIVMAIYNTGEYLHESINSIINQTLNFENYVQLILVDDGSTDNSLEICSEYKRQYPENIVILSQDNNGQAVARNYGLQYIQGKYVNFLDSDDYLSKNTLEDVLEFFEENEDEIDLVAIPMKYFGKKTNNHLLNGKFDYNKIIDLKINPDNPQLSASSAFFKKELFPTYQFETDVLTSEDSIMVNKILFEKMKYGVIKSAIYYYRKRFDQSSTIDKSIHQKELFIEKFDKYYYELINYSFKKTGKIEEFIHYLLAYDIQWLIKELDIKILSESEKEVFWSKLSEILHKLNKEVVNSPYITDNAFKTFLLYLITDELNITTENNNSIIKVGGKEIDNFQSHDLEIDIVEIKNNFLNISGLFESYFNSENIRIEAEKIDLKTATKKEFIAEKVTYPTRDNIEFLDTDWLYKYNFDLKIPLDESERCDIRIVIRYFSENEFSSVISSYPKLNFCQKTHISYISNYIVKDSHILTFVDNVFSIEPYRFKKMINEEKIVQKNIVKSKRNGLTSVLFLRCLAVLYQFLYSKNILKTIYLFMDRNNKADDNAEHLFKYALKQNDNIKKYFILKKDSKDFKRLSKIGSVVEYRSFKHKLLYLVAQKCISSHPDESLLNPFFEEDKNKDNRQLFSGLFTVETYFLQHGVANARLTNYLQKYDKNLSLLLTSSDKEQYTFVHDDYGYDENIIQALGLPRHDKLQDTRKDKEILIIPSYRNNIEGSETIFINSPYFKTINNLLKNKELVDYAQKNDYIITFKPHPRLEYIIPNTNKRYVDMFEINPSIRISYDESYTELFNRGSLLVTDYSSVSFDFAYLKKPIVYYQKNDDYHQELGYFDYENMGFGEVIKDENTLIDLMKEYMNNDCEMKEKYIERVNDFFKYNDKNNSKRVYDWIKEH